MPKHHSYRDQRDKRSNYKEIPLSGDTLSSIVKKTTGLPSDDDFMESDKNKRPILSDNIDGSVDVSYIMQFVKPDEHYKTDVNNLVETAAPYKHDDDYKFIPVERPILDDSDSVDKIFVSEKFAEIFENNPSQGEKKISKPTRETGNAYETAKYLRSKLHFTYFNKRLHVFQSPAYVCLEENGLIALLKTYVSPELIRQPMSFWKQVVGHLKTSFGIDEDFNLIDHPIEEVPFQNGICNIFTGELREASPEDKLLIYNHCEYDPENAKNGETAKAFFDSVSGGDKEVKHLLYAVIGAILVMTSIYKKFFLLYGPSNSGKSVFGSLCEYLVGVNNCSHIALEQLGHKYAPAQLYGKMLNTSMDTSACELKNLGVLKRLTSGGKDVIEPEGKYAGFCKLRPDRIKLMFATNSTPMFGVKEDKKSIRNRMLVLPFLNEISPEKQDPDLLNKLIAEKDYIIRRGLKWFKCVMENNYQFPHCQLSEDLLEEFIPTVDYSDNPLQMLIDDGIIELDPQSYITNEDLYGIYKSHCENNFIPSLTYTSFIRGVKKNIFVTDKRIETSDGKRPHCILGIRYTQK